MKPRLRISVFLLILLWSLGWLAQTTGLIYFHAGIEGRVPKAIVSCGPFSCVINGEMTRASWGDQYMVAPFVR